MNTYNENTTFITGPSKGGKTYQAKELISQYRKTKPELRIIVISFYDEYKEFAKELNGSFYSACSENIVNDNELIIINISDDNESQCENALKHCIKLMNQNFENNSESYIFIEEPEHFINSEDINALCLCNRSHNCSFYFMSQDNGIKERLLRIGGKENA